METDDYDTKQRGNANYKHQHHRHGDSTAAEARSVHYKCQRCRGWRREADRHSHHRRRKVMKEAIAHGAQTVCITSSTCAQHRTQQYGHWSSIPKIESQKQNRQDWEM